MIIYVIISTIILRILLGVLADGVLENTFSEISDLLGS